MKVGGQAKVIFKDIVRKRIQTWDETKEQKVE